MTGDPRDREKPAAQYRQGDVLLVATRLLDREYDEVERVGDRLVLARGEATGHAHAVESPQARLLRRALNLYLVVDGPEPAVLRHEEHAPIRVPPGAYEVRQQREFTVDRGAAFWRRVRD